MNQLGPFSSQMRHFSKKSTLNNMDDFDLLVSNLEGKIKDIEGGLEKVLDRS